MVTSMQAPPALLWIDLETTGLDPDKGCILEVCAVLDAPAASMTLPAREIASMHSLGREPRRQVQVLDRVIIHDDPDALPWEPVAREMHSESGLLEALEHVDLESGRYLALPDVEAMLVAAIAPCPHAKVVLAGSSVHFDRAWIRVHMPELDGKLSHRHMDASCIGTWMTMLGDPVLVPKTRGHRASSDVWHSIRTFYLASETVFGWQEDSTDAAHLRRLLARGSA